MPTSAAAACLGFAGKPTPMTPLAHVEERAADLSQARPELGHATNAACIVGRRRISQGVFLDRRAFLVSYDPTIDPSGSILERILLAVGPVCAGINLEYFFLDGGQRTTGRRHQAAAQRDRPYRRDERRGQRSAHRPARQMIEIHEPIRLQLILDAKPDTVTAILACQPPLAELCNNAWVQLIAVDPVSGATWVSPGLALCRLAARGNRHAEGPHAAAAGRVFARGLLRPAPSPSPVLIQAPIRGPAATGEGLRP